MTKRLYLIRHAEPAGPGASQMNGWNDVPLSLHGREQAELVADAIGPSLVQVPIFASPLQRTRDTARALQRVTGGALRLLDSLKEIGCGEVDGWPVSLVQERHPELWARNLAQTDDDFAWPGGESYRSVRRRSLRAVRAIAHSVQERAVIVTHTGVITQLVGSLRGIASAKWESFRVRHASVTELQCDGERAEVVSFDRVYWE